MTWTSADTLFGRILASQGGQIVPGGGRHILIACMPKSASTYLCGIIGALPQMSRFDLVTVFHRREQELCPLRCALSHDMNYVAAHHVRYSQATQELLTSYKILPVVLVRNIFDCAVSLRDHLSRESLDIPQAYVPRNFPDLSVKSQYDFIIEFILPWYASFFASWTEYNGPSVSLAYEQLIENFPAAVITIMNAVGIELTYDDIEVAISKVNPNERRFNVGRVGRGREELAHDQVDRIKRQFSYFADVPGLHRLLRYDDQPAT